MLTRILIAASLLLLAGYGVWKAVPLLEGPRITVSTPTDGQSFPSGFILIEGVASHTENLTLNGGPLPIDKKGHFSTSLVLPAGSAILSLTATDRFGKRMTVRRTVLVP